MKYVIKNKKALAFYQKTDWSQVRQGIRKDSEYLVPTLECKVYWNWIDAETRITNQVIPVKMSRLSRFSAKRCLELWPKHIDAKIWKRNVKCGWATITAPPEMPAQAIGRKGRTIFS